MASNPFDDTPPPTPTMSHVNAMNHVNKHMVVGPCMSPAGNPMMGSMSPCQIVGSPMSCGPPVGSPINCGPPLGSCSPMGGAGSNANCGPIGSPLTSCSGRQVNRSPLVCPPMSQNSVMSNSSMNVNSVHPMNRSPSSMGSPLSSVMASNVRGNSPLDCGLGISSVGSQKGSPMSVMGSHNMNSLNCGSPMGSPSNVPMSSCGSGGNMIGSPVPSPLSVPCSLSGGSDMNLNLNGVMNRSPMNAPPNSVNASMMCSSSMRGPSPISGGPMNGPMSMNCNQNMNMGPKSDMNMNELAMRENCGPGLMSMKPNNGPGPCGMPVNSGSYNRQPDMGGMQCGPMNNMHCNPMMSNQCGPGMSNLPCMPGGMNRPPCGPGGGPLGMNNPYDGMNPQCRPPMNRSQFSRGMPNMPYGPNSMNAPMNGPNMNMCGPPDMVNMPCGPNNSSNVSNMHCSGDPPMSNSQCMGQNMNQCSGSMFNSQFSPFDGNNPRCSPNLPFTSQDMGMNNNFYRSIMSNAPCMPNMNHAVSTGADSLHVDNSIMSTGNSMKNDCSTVDSDIASVVCSITNDTSDDLNLIDDNLLRDTKSDDSKSVKDLLLDDGTDNKDDEMNDSKPNKNELDSKMNEEKESKVDGEVGKSEASSTPSPTTTVASSIAPVSGACTAIITNRSSTVTTSITTTNVTNNETNVSGEEHPTNSVCAKIENVDEDEFSFKKNSSDSTKSVSESNENVGGDEDTLSESKVKNEPEEKVMQNEFNEEEDAKNREEKQNKEEGGKAKSIEENMSDSDQRKENTNGVSIKVESEEFFDNNMKPKMEPGTGVRGNGNGGYNNSGMMPNAPNNFSVPTSGDMSGMMNNSGPCMNDSMCGSPMLPNMNRMPMPQPPMNNNMNYANRPMNMYTGRVS